MHRCTEIISKKRVSNQQMATAWKVADDKHEHILKRSAFVTGSIAAERVTPVATKSAITTARSPGLTAPSL